MGKQQDHVEVLRMVLDGRISGRISEWPQLKPAIAAAISVMENIHSIPEMRRYFGMTYSESTNGLTVPRGGDE